MSHARAVALPPLAGPERPRPPSALDSSSLGVRSVALASGVPGGYDQGLFVVIPEGYQFPDGDETAGFVTSRVNAEYFETLDVEIVRGRGFGETDDQDSPLVAMVNEFAGERYWPGEDPSWPC